MLKWLKQKREILLLLPILILTAFLTSWKIWQEGNANAYYTAAVTSMLQSPHNFFFASFDPGGFITVDKPALGLWLQAASGFVFGVHGWSMILPEAMCAVASVTVLYRIVRRGFGAAAGLISALALAVTPIFVAVARSNNLDSSLALAMVLAAWALLTAVERGSLWRLLLAMALVGIGFNIKMLQAWMILPALLLTYLTAAKTPMKKRLVHLAAGAAVVLTVSLSWAVVVDLTPAAQRPYVGGSGTNSVLHLAVDYNGIQRVLPGSSQDGGAGMSSGLGGGIGMQEGGSAGVLRLFNENMAGQASWLIPFAFFGMLALLLALRNKEERHRARTHLLLWAGWALPMMAYFSITGFFHRYYLAVLAPALAALAGIGAVLLWQMWKRGGWKIALLPASIVTTVAVQCIILSRYDEWGAMLIPAVCTCGALSTACFIAAALLKRRECEDSLTVMAVTAGMLALLAAPAAWSLTPILYGSQTMLPIAGPELSGDQSMTQGQPSFSVRRQSQPDGPGGGQGDGRGSPQGGQNVSLAGSGSNNSLIAFLLKNSTGEKFLVAVPDANTAAPIIIETGKPVMAVGGFLGSDNALSIERLKEMVKNDELRYFMTGSRMGQQNALLEWVRQNGTEVSASQWGGSSSGWDQSGTLYDLAPKSAG